MITTAEMIYSCSLLSVDSKRIKNVYNRLIISFCIVLRVETMLFTVCHVQIKGEGDTCSLMHIVESSQSCLCAALQKKKIIKARGWIWILVQQGLFTRWERVTACSYCGYIYWALVWVCVLIESKVCHCTRSVHRLDSGSCCRWQQSRRGEKRVCSHWLCQIFSLLGSVES